MAFLYIMLLRCWFIRDVSQLVSLLEEIGPINWKFILVIVSDNWGHILSLEINRSFIATFPCKKIEKFMADRHETKQFYLKIIINSCSYSYGRLIKYRWHMLNAPDLLMGSKIR